MWKKYVILLENFVISLYVMHIILQLKITKANVRQSESSMKSTDCHEFLSFCIYIKLVILFPFACSCMSLMLFLVTKKIQIYFFLHFSTMTFSNRRQINHFVPSGRTSYRNTVTQKCICSSCHSTKWNNHVYLFIIHTSNVSKSCFQ